MVQIKNAHAEYGVIVHDEVVDYERTPLVDLPEGSRPSIGEAFEVPYQPMDVPKKLKGKLDKMTVGSYVLYATDKPNKICKVGLILSVHRTEQGIVVHRLEPCSNASLRVRWL